MPYIDEDPIDGPEGSALWERADRVLPGGGIYLTRSADMAGRGVLPGFIAAAEGCTVIDADGRRYIDFLAANGPNLLGYRHPEVEAAADAVRGRITTASLFPTTLVEVVEQLVERFPPMTWGAVAKNGSEAVSLAARVARQRTQRTKLVAFERAYHGNDPELASGPRPGALTEVTADVVRVPWNDAERLSSVLAAEPVAAVLLNPLDQTPGAPTVAPSDDLVAAIAEGRDRHGVLVVLDDVRHGFRLHPDGSHRPLGLEPDLYVLGKALGNGHSISAVLGVDDVRSAARKILFTSTYMFEAPPMAAAVTTLQVYDRDGVFERMTAMGERLRNGLEAAADEVGLPVTLTGPVTMPTLLVDDDPDRTKIRRFCRAAAGAGAVFHPFLNWFLSGAHGPDDVDAAVAAARVGFEAARR